MRIPARFLRATSLVLRPALSLFALPGLQRRCWLSSSFASAPLPPPSVSFKREDEAALAVHKERMTALLEQLRRSRRDGETDPPVPIAASLYDPSGNCLATATNSNESCLHHAEMLVLEGARKAMEELQASVGEQRLQSQQRRLDDGCCLYVTAEPCLMCLGAAMLCRVSKIVYGCRNDKFGAFTTTAASAAATLACQSSSSSLAALPPSSSSSSSPFRGVHAVEVVGGVMEEEAAQLLREFFRAKRR